MVGNDVCVITKSLGNPNPFISIGKIRSKRQQDKITRYAHNFVIGDIPYAVIRVATRPKDIESLHISRFDWKCKFYGLDGVGLGMVDALLLQIAGLMVLQTLVMIWGLRSVVRIVNEGLQSLDLSVAGALKQILEGGIGDFEPPNPILQAIASRLMAQPAGIITEVRSKDDKGRFV